MTEQDVIAAVYGEARDDLNRLIAAGREVYAKHGEAAGAVHFTQGLLDHASWSRVMLASVVGAAVMRIVAAEDGVEPAKRCTCDVIDEPQFPHRAWCALMHDCPGASCEVCSPPAAESRRADA